MWNRGDSPRGGTSDNPAQAGSSVHPDTAASVAEAPSTTLTPAGAKTVQIARLGILVFVKGELKGSEDVTLDGRFEGRIDLPDHTLTVGPNANVQADIAARIVIVFGSVVGHITARDKVEIRRGGSLEGQLASPRIAIQEGAHLCGQVEMPTRKPKHDGKQMEMAPPALPVAV